MENTSHCGNCGGCCRTLELTRAEVEMLRRFGQIPFLPVARKADSMTPYYLEDNRYSVEEYGVILQNMERKGLISLDFDQPLSGFDGSAYRGYPILGSMALTARGQSVLEQIERQGVEE